LRNNFGILYNILLFYKMGRKEETTFAGTGRKSEGGGDRFKLELLHAQYLAALNEWFGWADPETKARINRPLAQVGATTRVWFDENWEPTKPDRDAPLLQIPATVTLDDLAQQYQEAVKGAQEIEEVKEELTKSFDTVLRIMTSNYVNSNEYLLAVKKLDHLHIGYGELASTYHKGLQRMTMLAERSPAFTFCPNSTTGEPEFEEGPGDPLEVGMDTAEFKAYITGKITGLASDVAAEKAEWSKHLDWRRAFEEKAGPKGISFFGGSAADAELAGRVTARWAGKWKQGGSPEDDAKLWGEAASGVAGLARGVVSGLGIRYCQQKWVETDMAALKARKAAAHEKAQRGIVDIKICSISVDRINTATAMLEGRSLSIKQNDYYLCVPYDAARTEELNADEKHYADIGAAARRVLQICYNP